MALGAPRPCMVTCHVGGGAALDCERGKCWGGVLGRVQAVLSSGRAGVASVARGVWFPSDVLWRLALWEGVALFPVSSFSDARFLHLVTQFVHSCLAFLHVQDMFQALKQQQYQLQLQHGGTMVRSVGVARLRLRAHERGFAV